MEKASQAEVGYDEGQQNEGLRESWRMGEAEEKKILLVKGASDKEE